MSKGYTVRYNTDYHFETTEDGAKKFCDQEITKQTDYVRRHYNTHYMPWEARDKQGNVKEKAYLCIYPKARYY